MSKPQHMQALDKANEWRLKRAKLKGRVREGKVLPEEVIAEPPRYARNMTVGELLRAQERWGRARTRKFLAGLDLLENRTLGKLTLRQRTVLAGALQEKHQRQQRERERNERKAAKRAAREQAERAANYEDFLECPGCGCEVPRTELVGSLFGKCNRCESGQLAESFGPGPHVHLQEGPANGTD